MRRLEFVLIWAILTPLSAQTGAGAGDLGRLSEEFRALARKVNPSVVKVVAVGYRAVEEDESGETGVASRQQSSGSGVIIDRAGYVVTNAHVVMNAQRVQVTLPNLPDAAPPRASALRPTGRIVRAELVF